MNKSSDKSVREIKPFGVYTAESAAEVLGMSKLTLQKHIRKGRLIAAKAGREYRITGNNLLSYLGTAVWPVEERQNAPIDNRGAVTPSNYEEHR